MRLPFLIALTPLLGACATYHSIFPSRESIYKPVPLEVGTLRVTGSDSSYVVTGPGYVLAAPTRELLPEPRLALDEAAREYRRIFSAVPPTLQVQIDRVDRNQARAEQQNDLSDDSTSSTVVLRVYSPRDPSRAQQQQEETGARIRVRPVASRWLRARVGSGTPLPFWLRSGVTAALAPSPFDEMGVARLVDRPKDMVPLRTLFAATPPARPARTDLPSSERPPAGRPDGLYDPRWRGGPESEMSAEAYAFVQFMADREGIEFVGRTVDNVAHGGTIEAAFQHAAKLPHDIDALDNMFRHWLEEKKDSPRGSSGR